MCIIRFIFRIIRVSQLYVHPLSTIPRIIESTLRLNTNWISFTEHMFNFYIRGQLKCDGTRAWTRFRLLAKGTSPFKSAEGGGGASVQSTAGSRGVRISGSNTGYTMFRGSVKGTGYPFHSPVSPSLPLPCITVRHHISTGLYFVICKLL